MLQGAAVNVVSYARVSVQRSARHDVREIVPLSSQLQIPRFARDDNKKHSTLLSAFAFGYDLREVGDG